MNEIINKFLLEGDKFLSEIHLKQPWFTYGVSGPFTNIKERIQKFKEIGDSRFIYQNELDKLCFPYDMVKGDFKNVTRKTVSDNILRDKPCNIDKNLKYDRDQRWLDSMNYI